MTPVAASFIHIDMDTEEDFDLTTKNGRLRWARTKANFRSARAAGLSMGLKPSTYPAHENGQNQFEEDAAKLYGKTFGVSWVWLLLGTGSWEPSDEERALYASMPDATSGGKSKSPASNVSFPPKHQRLGSEKAIPLRGQTIGGANGKFVFNGQTVDHVFCPPNLLNVDGAYAARIYGTSMEPRYKAGETIWINPIEPVRAGDDVVVQIVHGDDDHPESYIKEFVSLSAKVLRLRQLNPDEGEEEILEFPADKVFSVHKVVFHAKA